MTALEILSVIIYPLFLFTILLTIYAQYRVSHDFKKYSSLYTRKGATATDVARMILASNGVHGVAVGRVGGHLTDHYNPRSNTLALSDSVAASTGAAAIGVAAHEAGHAIQHSVGYFPIRLRMWLVPITSFASKMSWIFIFLGIIFASLSFLGEVGFYILLAGVGLFALSTLFQLVTLPCEFNASRRAMSALRASGWYDSEELYAARKVLTSAALTYVAATLSSIVQLLRLLLILFSRRNNRR